MISGGNATIFVSNMDRAVEFYTKTLGLTMTYRAGDHWASIDAGSGLQIGLHPETPNTNPPGAKGGIQLGLQVTKPIGDVVATLKSSGVRFRGDIVDEGVKLAAFNDPDGNELYLFEVE